MLLLTVRDACLLLFVVCSDSELDCYFGLNVLSSLFTNMQEEQG